MLPFSPFQHGIKVPAKAAAGTGRGYHYSTPLATTSLVPQAIAGPSSLPHHTTKHRKDPFPTPLRCDPPTQSETEAARMPGIRGLFQVQGLSESAIDILMASWRPATQKEYQVYLDKWHQFCGGRGVNPLLPPVEQVIEYLVDLFQERSYSTVNTARSALSALGLKIDGLAVGTHPLVVRLLKGMHNIKPPRVRYTSTWDPDIVLRHLKSLGPNDKISLKLLTLKLCMLLALTQASRPQTLHLITINNLLRDPEKYTFQIDGLLKHSRPGVPIPPITVHKYPHDTSLCPYLTAREYLNRTDGFRTQGKHQLFLSYVKPHKAVSVDTIRRWLKLTMDMAGVDTTLFRAYSTRSASASKAAASNVPTELIMKTAGWSRESTFAKFYLRNIEPNVQFADQVLRIN